MFASLWSRWNTTSRSPQHCRTSPPPPPPSLQREGLTSRHTRTEPPPGILGIKKQFQLPAPLRWPDGVERRHSVKRGAAASSPDSDKFHWDFHFKQLYTGGICSRRREAGGQSLRTTENTFATMEQSLTGCPVTGHSLMGFSKEGAGFMERLHTGREMVPSHVALKREQGVRIPLGKHLILLLAWIWNCCACSGRNETF